MSKTLTTKANSVFLATVLVAGIIALSYPSFMIGAQAQEFGMDQRYNNHEKDYGMDSYDKKPYEKDNSYDKYKDSSSVNVKKIVCNNFNINGLDLGGASALNGLTGGPQAADEGANGANSFGSGSGSDGRSSSHDGDNTKVVCIFNNGAEEEPKDECLLCFDEISDELRDAIEDLLATPGRGPIVISDDVSIPVSVTTIELFCDFLAENAPIILTESEIEDLIDDFVASNRTTNSRG